MALHSCFQMGAYVRRMYDLEGFSHGGGPSADPVTAKTSSISSSERGFERLPSHKVHFVCNGALVVTCLGIL
jgi:hypothetical protein